MKSFSLIAALGLTLAATTVLSAAAQDAAPAAAKGKALFEQRCVDCHSGDDERAPGPADLATMTPQHIFEAMKTGAMAPMAGGLADEEMHAIAAYLTAPKPAA